MCLFDKMLKTIYDFFSTFRYEDKCALGCLNPYPPELKQYQCQLS